MMAILGGVGGVVEAIFGGRLSKGGFSGDYFVLLLRVYITAMIKQIDA